MRAAGANKNARYLCKCVGLILDGMKQNDEIDLYTLKQFSVCLNLGIGSNVSDCEFCRPQPPPRTRGGLQI